MIRSIRDVAVSALTSAVILVIGAFLLIRLIPGDPALRIAGRDARADVVEAIHERLGLDRSLPEQFTDYIGGLFSGDLGRSFVTNEPVSAIIEGRTPKTFQLTGAAMAIVMVVSISSGLLFGVLTRAGRRPVTELVFSGGTGLVGSVPEYIAGTLLVLLFAIVLGWLPIAGSAGWSALVLPAIAVAARPTALLSRIVRVETIGAFSQDYVRVATSKRLPVPFIAVRHVLPNVVTSALGVGGVLLSGLLGGTVIVENVFAWPGLGSKVIEAMSARDYPVVQGIILFLGLCVVAINAFVDGAIALLDPRRGHR